MAHFIHTTEFRQLLLHPAHTRTHTHDRSSPGAVLTGILTLWEPVAGCFSSYRYFSLRIANCRYTPAALLHAT